MPVSVSYSAKMDAFGIENHGYSPLISQKYVVKGDFEVYDGMDLLHHAMLNTLPNINKDGGKDEHGKTIRIPDFEARQKADTLITEIRQVFVEWLHAQPDDFKERLTDLYNRKFNCYVRPRYDGSHQQFPGLDLRGLGIDDLYPSQKDAIWMIKQNGGGICDHEVGTGKTLIMCVAAYEMHRLGLARKPMIIGIKANIHEIARTFRTAYPNARLLYPGKEDFTPENRLRIFSDIKNNNWDCIILTHEQFGKIPQSAEVQQQILRQEMDDIDENLASYEKQGGHVDGWILCGLEKRKENLDAKLHELQETIDAQKDDTVDFQQMGIDHLFVDESHNFKNLMFNTRHSRVSGLGNTDGSKKATNLLYAIRTIQQRTGRDLGATFLSGTTIANSLTELYLLFKYLRPKELERQDIPCFDAWAAVFAQKTSEFEFSVTNEVISKERFRYFIKVPELAMFYNEITDYRTAADVGIDRPELDEEVCQIPMTDDQQAFLDKLVLFAKTGDPEHIGRANLSDGEVKALMLLVTMYSNKLSLDMRLISPAYADSPGNKASRSAANIAEYYRRYDGQKGTQMVFCDLSTYKPSIWNVYSEIKRKLVEDHGIPAQEIRFVQEAASDKVRQAMFDAMNEGKIRVLFGSTQKLGTGVNAQQRIVAMHHLDIPWRPMDLEQRNGRGARKGNIVAKEYAGNKVKAYVYAVLRTLDAYKLNLLHNKQQFIDQLKRNRLGARRLDEGAISEDSGMNFAEWMAVVSGNTDLLQKAKLEGRIAALESEQTIFMRTRHEAQSQLQRYTAEIGRRDAMLERLKRDWDYINEVAPPDAKGKRANPLRIDGVESADIVAHGKRLVEIDRTVNTGDDYQKIGTLFDFRILVRTERMQKDGLALTVNKFMVEGLDGIKYTFNNGHLAAEPKTAATNFIRALDTIPSLMATYEKEKKQFTRDIPTFEQQIAAVWPKEEELKRLKTEAESLTRKIQLDIAQKQQEMQEMQAKTADNGNGLKIENAEVVDEVIKPSKAEPLSTASGNQEEPPEEREHVMSPPESDFIRNHILLVRPATNMKAKGPKL
ncbi:helicase-related protein [Alistipes shahii]|uniref:helicase-related protein n=2 Tax=Alistipes shahii TaxID=328814 RepID=UPI003F7C4401